MKSIEERAAEYVHPIRMQGKHPEADATYNGFIAGARLEHKELTRWNKPNVLPDKDMVCLGKTKYYNEEIYELLIYKSEQKMFISRQTFIPIMPHKLIGWREIHE